MERKFNLHDEVVWEMFPGMKKFGRITFVNEYGFDVMWESPYNLDCYRWDWHNIQFLNKVTE